MGGIKMKYPKVAATTLVAIVTAMAIPLLKKHEDTKLESYPDVVDVWTICSGVTSIPGVGAVTPGMRMTKQQCDDLDRAIAEGFTMEVAKRIKVPISAQSMLAHVTFAYNIGVYGYSRSAALRETNKGRHEDGCRAMMNWYRAGGKDCRIRESNCRGLITRRKSEVDLCLEGTL